MPDNSQPGSSVHGALYQWSKFATAARAASRCTTHDLMFEILEYLALRNEPGIYERDVVRGLQSKKLVSSALVGPQRGRVQG